MKQNTTLWLTATFIYLLMIPQAYALFTDINGGDQNLICPNKPFYDYRTIQTTTTTTTTYTTTTTHKTQIPIQIINRINHRGIINETTTNKTQNNSGFFSDFVRFLQNLV
jgi:hypothetical protein